jgi:hypothetical protein
MFDVANVSILLQGSIVRENFKTSSNTSSTAYDFMVCFRVSTRDPVPRGRRAQDVCILQLALHDIYNLLGLAIVGSLSHLVDDAFSARRLPCKSMNTLYLRVMIGAPNGPM